MQSTSLDSLESVSRHLLGAKRLFTMQGENVVPELITQGILFISRQALLDVDVYKL